jgi:uncharacterized protein YkwD
MMRKKILNKRALFVTGLIASALVVGVLRPAVSGMGKSTSGVSVQYFPYVLGCECVPFPYISPDDVKKDLSVEARINEIRDRYNLPHFSNSEKITQAALRHSNDMADNNFFSHTGSDGSNAGTRLEDACYKWWAYGEIIAAGYTTPASVVDAWMGSSGHRGIILDPQYTEFGAGYAYKSSSRYKHYWTVDFGLPEPGLLADAGDYHLCSYHVKDEQGEIWAQVYTSQPCGDDGYSAPGMLLEN